MRRIQYKAILIMLILFQSTIILADAMDESYLIKIEILSYTETAPLSINSDMELDGLGLPGNGSEADPYTFSGYNITSTDLNLVTISNTTQYIEISDNIFVGLSDEQIGISLYNVSNIKIINN